MSRRTPRTLTTLALTLALLALPRLGAGARTPLTCESYAQLAWAIAMDRDHGVSRASSLRGVLQGPDRTRQRIEAHLVEMIYDEVWDSPAAWQLGAYRFCRWAQLPQRLYGR